MCGFSLCLPHKPLRPTLLNVLKKKNAPCSFPPPPHPSPFGALCPQHSRRAASNFVKHAKLLKSPARDLDSCAAPQPGRCKGREDLCYSGLVLPRVHTHTKRRLWKKEERKKGGKKGACRNHREMLKSSREKMWLTKRFLLSVNITNVIHHHNHKIHLTC